MTLTDRNEVREMIVATLGGWHSETVIREVTTNKALDKIEKHLEQLNSKVATHEKILNQNIPHTIDKCVQSSAIQEIRDSMITGKAITRAIIIGISSTGALASIFFILFKIFIEKTI